jgi:peptide/nickel transport system permease protein
MNPAKGEKVAPKKAPAAGGGGQKPSATSGRLLGELRHVLAPRIREIKFDFHVMSKSLTSLTGLFLLAVLIAVAAFPWLLAEPAPGRDPYLLPFDPSSPDPLPPSNEHLFGTGKYGADIFYGIVWGSRISMSFAMQVVGLSVIFGTVLGLISGYKGGLVDEAMMRVTDVFLSIPSLVLVMAIAAALGKDLESTKLALMAVWWSGYTRIIRGQVLSVRENAYIDAARASGSGELKIMFRHALPNSWPPVLVAATMDMGSVVLTMAALSFLGLGAQTGYSEWGKMIYDGQQYFYKGDWWMVVFPGMAILIFVMAFNLLGDGLRDVFDPKMRR